MGSYTNPIIDHDNADNDEYSASEYITNDFSNVEANTIDSSSQIANTCPTCQGKGKLTQSQADNLVALIPARDKRLKPIRTRLYLGITTIVLVVIIVLIAFFLWPRSLYLKILSTHTVKINIPDKGDAYIDVEVLLQVHNENLFDAKVRNINVDVTWNKIYTLNTPKTTFVDGHVSSGGVKNFTFISRQEFGGVVLTRMKVSCKYGWFFSLFEKFDISASIVTVLRNELVTETYYGYTQCYNSTGIDR